jgi:hypothetical protein
MKLLHLRFDQRITKCNFSLIFPDGHFIAASVQICAEKMLRIRIIEANKGITSLFFIPEACELPVNAVAHLLLSILRH